jgi:hypothetical protein
MALMILSLTVASPVAWDHHYGVLLPIFALLLSANGRLLTAGEAWVLLIAFLLAAQPLSFTRYSAHTPLNVVQSTLFGAAVLTLLLLARAIPRAQVDTPDFPLGGLARNSSPTNDKSEARNLASEGCL